MNQLEVMNLELLLENKNIRKLNNILKYKLPENVKKISAAIAFNQAPLLLDTCIKRKIKLNWWGLFTSDISTKPELVRKALEHSDLVTFYPFAEHFHSKVIHFHGYGVYIGSHNMTKAAPEENVEAGVFILENELTEEQLNEVNNFFENLKSKSLPVTLSDVEKTKQIKIEQAKLKEEIEKAFKEQFGHLFFIKASQ